MFKALVALNSRTLLTRHFDVLLLRFCLATVVLMLFVAFSLGLVWLISVRLVTV